jgi:magnesium chelatase family protein
MTDQPSPAPGTAQTRSAVLTGAEGHLVRITAAVTPGPNAFQIPGPSLRETRDRVRAAIINSGLSWPQGTIAVSVDPTAMPGQDASLDLAIAVAVLAAVGQVAVGAISGLVLVAELGLDGSLRPIRGVLPAMLVASAAGTTAAIVAPDNVGEAGLAPGVTVISCARLDAVLAWLRFRSTSDDAVVRHSAAAVPDHPVVPGGELADLTVSPLTRRVLEACAAGGHHLRMTGSRRAAIPALAAATAALLPPLSRQEALEVAAIQSAAGLLNPVSRPVTQPSYQAPHHTVTLAALLGAGPGSIRPGAAALAHRGVLFLENAPDFDRDVLTALRQPLHDGSVTVVRGGVTTHFPARFILIASMNWCPCGSQPGCTCRPLQAARYRTRLTDNLGSYFDLVLHVSPADRPDVGVVAADRTSAGRVAAARDRARRRLSDTPWEINAAIPGAELRRHYLPPAGSLADIQRSVDVGQLSNRAVGQVIRVAWTLADLAGRRRPGRAECDDALAFHLGDTW